MLKTKIIHILLAVLLSSTMNYAQIHKTSENTPQLKEVLKKFPQADKNNDGILTIKEAKEFKETQKNKSSAQGKNEIGKIEISENGMLKIQYGDKEEEYFLLWRKETSIKRPIVIWAHQGGGHPNNFADEATVLNSMGVHALSWGTQSKENYTTMEEIDSLANSVLDWVIANADEYKIDTNQIIISGQSRGSGFNWNLAYRNYSGIKGIYMVQALGEKIMSTPGFDPRDNVTLDAPPIFFTWKVGAGLDGDPHTQTGAISVTNKYNSLGISDRVLGYEVDNEELYQYLPKFITNVLNW